MKTFMAKLLVIKFRVLVHRIFLITERDLA